MIETKLVGARVLRPGKCVKKHWGQFVENPTKYNREKPGAWKKNLVCYALS